MRSVLKALLFCLLAIAIPFQGYASAAMVGCAQAGPAPAHHAGAPAVHEQATGHDSHHAAGSHASHSGDDSADGDAAACAAMCMASAMIEAPSLVAPTASQRIAPYAAPDPFIPDARPTPLERPPRLA